MATHHEIPKVLGMSVWQKSTSSPCHTHPAECVLTKLNHIGGKGKKKSVMPDSFLTSCLMRVHTLTQATQLYRKLVDPVTRQF